MTSLSTTSLKSIVDRPIWPTAVYFWSHTHSQHPSSSITGIGLPPSLQTYLLAFYCRSSAGLLTKAKKGLRCETDIKINITSSDLRIFLIFFIYKSKKIRQRTSQSAKKIQVPIILELKIFHWTSTSFHNINYQHM